jgi:hypothetical protein
MNNPHIDEGTLESNHIVPKSYIMMPARAECKLLTTLAKEVPEGSMIYLPLEKRFFFAGTVDNLGDEVQFIFETFERDGMHVEAITVPANSPVITIANSNQERQGLKIKPLNIFKAIAKIDI